MYVCCFAHGGDTFPLGTTSLLEGSSGLQEAYTKACPNSAKKNYRNMLVPCDDTMPSFMIFWRVLDLQELKNQVSQSFRSSHDTQMFEFYSHFLHGTYKFTQRHTCGFSTNFGAPEHVLVVQIWIMHIKFLETQLMHKNAKRTRNNSKFKHDTHVLVACSLYINVLAIQTPSFPSVTPFCLSKHNEKIRYTTNSLLERIVWDAT